MHRLLALAFALCILAPQMLVAQPYPGVTPIPRTTDPAAARALVTEREVRERIRLGVAAEERRDWTMAVAEFSRVIALGPREPQGSTAFYDLGIARAGLGQYDAAADAFRSAIARDPGFLAARANLVTVELDRNDLPAARSAAQALVAAAPDSARGSYASGIVALRSGDAAAALVAFRTLLSNDPAYAVAHYNLGLAEQRLGRYDDAERELRTALSLAPTYTRATIALGAVLLREGKREAARVAFDDASRTSPDPALRNLAVSLRDAIVVRHQ